MGEFSDVVLVLMKSAVEKLHDYIEENNIEKNLFECADRHIINETTEEQLYSWEQVNWYSELPEVKYINKFIEQLDKEEYFYVVIGENNLDTTVLGRFSYSSFDVQLKTTINFVDPNVSVFKVYDD